MEQQNSTPRRKFFKRAALATLFGGIATGIGLTTFAHGGPGGGHRGGFMSGPLDPAKVDERLDRMLRHLYAEIDATPEQKALLAPIVKDAARDLLPLRDRLREARKQALELIAADSVDRDAIERLRADQIALADQASKRLTSALADVATVLTPAQRRDLAERAQRHRRGWHHG